MAYVFFEAIPDEKIAYLVIRKSGCTSIFDAFESIRSSSNSLDSNLARGRIKPADVPLDWFCFTFVREPVRRFLSFFADKIASSNLFGSVFQDCQATGFQPNLNLDQAIEVLTCGCFRPEAHVQLQSQIVAEAGVKLDFVGKLESYSDDLAIVNRIAKTNIPRLHKNPNGQLPILVSPDQYQRIAKHFHEDLVAFDYPKTFESWKSYHGFTLENTRPSSSIYQFGNQASLVRCDAFCEPEKSPKTIRMELTWQLTEKFDHARLARFICIEKNGAGKPALRNILKKLEPERKLASKADRDGIVKESIETSLDAMPENLRLESLLMDVCFWTQATKAAPLVNYGNPRTPQFRLELPVLSWLNRYKRGHCSQTK